MFQFFHRLTRDRFARRMMKAIATAGGPTDFVYDRDAFFLRRAEMVVNLGNVYHAYRLARGEQRQRIFDHFVAGSMLKNEIGTSFSAVEHQLVAVVRERAFLAAVEGPGWGLDIASDPFVAAYTLSQAQSGEYTSYSVWSKGVPTLLPVTDMVMFFDEAQPKEGRMVGSAKWDDVIAMLGDAMLDTKMFPTRYYVSTFPSREQLLALGKCG